MVENIKDLIRGLDHNEPTRRFVNMLMIACGGKSLRDANLVQTVARCLGVDRRRISDGCDMRANLQPGGGNLPELLAR